MSLDKVLIIDKPSGLTSHDVVDRVRRVYGVRRVGRARHRKTAQALRAGHAGTLDPLATGVLIVLVGKATKRQAEFMGLEKEYEVAARFGEVSDTYDVEGKVQEGNRKGAVHLQKQDICVVLKQFVGEIEQTVPPYSAVHVKGQRLYKLARQGKLAGIELPRKQVVVRVFELLHFTPAKGDQSPTAQFRVVCSKGTYIRSLIHDLGQALGCGAVVSELRRTRVGNFRVAEALTLEQLETTYPQPYSEAASE